MDSTSSDAKARAAPAFPHAHSSVCACPSAISATRSPACTDSTSSDAKARAAPAFPHAHSFVRASSPSFSATRPPACTDSTSSDAKARAAPTLPHAQSFVCASPSAISAPLVCMGSPPFESSKPGFCASISAASSTVMPKRGSPALVPWHRMCPWENAVAQNSHSRLSR